MKKIIKRMKERKKEGNVNKDKKTWLNGEYETDY